MPLIQIKSFSNLSLFV